MSPIALAVYHLCVMTRPRLLISLCLSAFAAALLTACGGGDLQVDVPTPTVTRAAVLAPTAPAVPSEVASPTPAPTVTEVPPTDTPTEVPSAVLEPVDSPTAEPENTPTPEATEVPQADPTQVPGEVIQFAPEELVQGGSAIVYFNQAATAATMSFGGKQYPMLFDGQRWWAIIGIGAFADPGVAPVTVTYDPADGSSQAQASGSIPIVERDYPVENIDLDAETSALLDPSIVNNEEAFRAAIFAGYTMQRLWDGPFQAPSTAAVGDGYGIARSYNGGPVTSYHRGTDFTGDKGDPAYAAAAGRVVFAGPLQVRGNAVIIDHGVGIFTTYNHLSEIDVSEGDTVTAGQTIGLIGSTGLVTGPHLHWEVIVRGIEVDGQLWLGGSSALP